MNAGAAQAVFEVLATLLAIERSQLQAVWAAREKSADRYRHVLVGTGRARRRVCHRVTASITWFLKNIQESSPSGLQIYDQQAKRVHNIKSLSLCDHRKIC